MSSIINTSHLRVVSRNPSIKRHDATTSMRQHFPVVKSAERPISDRNSLIRMGIAAAAAPALWIIHAAMQYVQRGH